MTFEERIRARRAQIRAQLEGMDVTLLPYYGSARDRIIRPDRALILRSYFVERWLPRLSGDELKIVLVLRNLTRTYGIEQEKPAVEVPVKHLMELTGISRGTLNRLLATPHLLESPLGQFVQKQAQRVPGIIGTIQGPNIYHVRMDDPIAPEDEAALREALADMEMERRYSAMFSEESAGQAPATTPPVQIETRIEAQGAKRPEAQTESQPVPQSEARPEAHLETQTTPLRGRDSTRQPDTQQPAPEVDKDSPNVGHINAFQHQLNNVQNVGEVSPSSFSEPLPRDLRMAQRDLHARHLARSLNDTQNLGWYRRIAQRFMDVGHEDLLYGALRDVLELPSERIKTTRPRVFTDRVKRLAGEYRVDLGLDD